MRRLPQLAVALAIVAALAAPAALASNGTQRNPGPSGCAQPSAVCVYYDGGPGGGGGKPGKVSSRLSTLIGKYGGKDKRLLAALETEGIFGHPEPGGGGSAGGSSALGAIFDMGAGPLGLLGTLLAAAAVFAGARLLRRRRAA